MIKYEVISKFVDLIDNKHVYEVGDSYPRDNYKPTDERIKELSTVNNKLKKAVIKAVENNEPIVSDKPKSRTRAKKAEKE